MPLFNYGAPQAPQIPPTPRGFAPVPPPPATGMPGMPQVPQMPTGYDMGPGGYGLSPQVTGRPLVPDPSLAAAPPSANATGGPMGAAAPIRASVYDQLYKLGKRMQGPANMFESLNPDALVAAPDPLAFMQPAPMEQPRVMPQLPPAPQPPSPDQYPPHLRPQQPQPMRPIDRYPRAAQLMGKPKAARKQAPAY